MSKSMIVPRGTMRREHRQSMHRTDSQYIPHSWDDEAICIHCGFDGAEWHHWKHHTYEGKASNARIPSCNKSLGDWS
jgi:hypothetical protein